MVAPHARYNYKHSCTISHVSLSKPVLPYASHAGSLDYTFINWYTTGWYTVAGMGALVSYMLNPWKQCTDAICEFVMYHIIKPTDQS